MSEIKKPEHPIQIVKNTTNGDHAYEFLGINGNLICTMRREREIIDLHGTAVSGQWVVRSPAGFIISYSKYQNDLISMIENGYVRKPSHSRQSHVVFLNRGFYSSEIFDLIEIPGQGKALFASDANNFYFGIQVSNDPALNFLIAVIPELAYECLSGQVMPVDAPFRDEGALLFMGSADVEGFLNPVLGAEPARLESNPILRSEIPADWMPQPGIFLPEKCKVIKVAVKP